MGTPNQIGTISSVGSVAITAILQGVPAQDGKTEKGAPAVGKLGSYVMMPVAGRSVIGSITSVRRADLPGAKAAKDAKEDGQPIRQEIEIQLIGTVSDGRFERSVSSYPMVGGPVQLPESADLQKIFAVYREGGFSPGTLSSFEQERIYLDPNKFFAKHIALFGSTGSGKSCTTASILQKVDKFENTHIIILDLHGEYQHAFTERGNIIKITELELPYWLMNFDELVETFVDETDPSATNQVSIMKEAIMDSKRGKNVPLKEFLTIDTPVFFDFLEVSARMRSLDTERTLGGKEGPFYGQFTRFLVRLEGRLTDKRYEFLFRPQKYKSSDTLAPLLTKLFGLDTGKQVTVIDLSRVPFDVINVLVSLLGRVIFDFNLWNKARQDFPVLIVFEEAHTYLSMTGRSKAARQTVERIAKEGRKYGVSCMIVSQRPAEISETITAQCNNFIAMRLLNPHDQAYVRKLVPDSLANVIDVLPTLSQGEAFFIGDAVPIPVRVMLDRPSPEPASGDIKFFEKWRKKNAETVVADVVNNWWKQLRS
ncbi:MAG TPA: helicase HerA-like domain-containing protein [Bacteroidota bacterium]|nr:helicase HerA-like domain-containing protein [Bacteroidota bacterium]